MIFICFESGDSFHVPGSSPSGKSKFGLFGVLALLQHKDTRDPLSGIGIGVVTFIEVWRAV